jgi:hypothetical protein
VELARALAVIAVVACSGNKARPGDDALRAPRADAAVIGDATPTATGELQIHVEWKSVPATARNSPGRTPCNTPRAASVAPTTTWGIPEAFVILDGGPAPGEARIVLADCAFRPRVAVATTLVLESAIDHPARVTLVKYGTVADGAALRPGEPRVIQLPIAGHAVSIALDPGGIYQLATDAKDFPETAWIVAAAAAVTDASGQAIVKGVPVGLRGISAWLPARGNELQHRAGSSGKVVANEPVEVTIDLAPPP